MNERDFDIILSLYQTKNLTRVAEKLFLSQPALTKRIKNIESELGAPIIVRSTRGIYFTSVGEKLVETSQKIVDTMQEMRKYVQNNTGKVSGSLHIGVPVDYAKWYMPEILEEYVLRYPDVSIDVSTGISSRIFRSLQSRDISCALIRGEYVWEEEKILLEEEPICLACRTKADRANLKASTYMDRTTDDTLHFQIHQWLEENNLQVRPRLHVDDIGTCQRLIKTGKWIIAPGVVLKGFDGYVEPLLLKDGTPLVRRTYIMYRSAYMELPQVRAFVELLIENRKAAFSVI